MELRCLRDSQGFIIWGRTQIRVLEDAELTTGKSKTIKGGPTRPGKGILSLGWERLLALRLEGC